MQLKFLKNIVDSRGEIFFCKYGNIFVNMVETKKVKKWTMNLFDKEGKPIRFEIEFNNAVGNGKRSGATTMFKIFK